MSTKMLMYIVKRLLLAILTIFIVITVTFFAMNAIPGGPFLSEKSTTQAILDRLNEKYGLDQPLYVQYFRYLKGALVFDFGPSIKTRGREVNEIIFQGFSYSLKLGAAASIIAIGFGISMGSIAAVKHNKWIDKTIMVTSTASVAMPSFIISSLFLLFFCVMIPIFPANGASAGGSILPIITLSLYPMAYITRLTRSSTLDVLNQDYIRTAKAKGVNPAKILFKHALRNSLTPVITYVGPMFAYIITGSLVVERIFAMPGLGRTFVNSINQNDYPLIMGTTIFLTVIVVFMLLVSDILYKVANPRIELE